MNENQVAISESTLGTVRKLVNNTPSAKIDLTMLSLLGMERSKTARECIADHGRPGREIRLRLQRRRRDVRRLRPQRSLDLRDHARRPAVGARDGQARRGLVRPARARRPRHASAPTSPASARSTWTTRTTSWARSNIVSFAVEQKLYDPASGKPFNWKHAYSPAEGSALSTHGPAASGCGASCRRSSPPPSSSTPRRPTWTCPSRSSPTRSSPLQDVMNLTRDKSYGTIFDPVQGIRGGPFQNPNYYAGTRKISVANVEYTSLVQCRRRPAQRDRRHRLGGLRRPGHLHLHPPLRRDDRHSQVLHGRRPFRSSTGPRPAGPSTTSTSTPRSSTTRPSRTSRRSRSSSKAAAIQKIPEIDKAALALYAKSPAKAREYLTKTAIEKADRRSSPAGGTSATSCWSSTTTSASTTPRSGPGTGSSPFRDLEEGRRGSSTSWPTSETVAELKESRS